MKQISIITPSLNQGDFIRDAIESVLAQNDPCFEHIVVDGGSTDDTVAILESYPHLRWVSEPDRGQSDAVNKGVHMATGEIIGSINSDDYYLKKAFSPIRETMSREGASPVCIGGCDYVREGRTILSWQAHPIDLTRALRFPVDVIPHPPLFVTRELWQEIGGMDPAIRYGPDVDLILRLARRHRFDSVSQSVAVNRVHSDAIQEQEWDRNFTARLYHVARHGQFENFHQMYFATHGQFGEASNTFPALLTAYVQQKWQALAQQRIAIYGAGSHSRWLEEITAGLEGPEVTAVLDQAPNPGIELWGIPTIRPEDFDQHCVTAILLSSDTQQENMARQCRLIHGNQLPLIDFYEGLPPGPYRK